MAYWDMLNKENSYLVAFLNMSHCDSCSPVLRFVPRDCSAAKGPFFHFSSGASGRPSICVASVSRPEFIIESAVESADTLPRFNLSLLSVFSAYCMAGGSKRGISHDFMTRTSILSSNVFGSLRSE